MGLKIGLLLVKNVFINVREGISKLGALGSSRTHYSFLQEALLLQLNDQNKKIIISSLCRSPSQNSEEFESFLTNFEHLLSDINARKPSVSVILGDFNARSTPWWSSDIDSLEGSKLFSWSTLNDFHQIISELTHVQRNSSSCID